MARAKDLGSRPDIALALGKVDSDKVEHRLNGLLELRKIINDNRQNPKLKQVDDKGYHAILETVFRVAKIDILGLARASKYTGPKITSRLSACASLVRTVVEVGLIKLRHKTVKALIDHISQTLPTADAGYCEPLLVDYFKALSTLLGYRAHVEHLSSGDWHEVTQFCADTIQDLNRSTVTTNGDVYSVSGSLNSRSRVIAKSGLPCEGSNSFSSYDSQQFEYPQLQSSNDDILSCMRHLFGATNAPIVEKADPVLTLVLDLLSRYPHLSKIQQSSYEIVDSILARIIVCDISLSLRTINALIPLIRKTWQRASPWQREPMLSVLIRCDMLIGCLLRSEHRYEARDCLVSLLESIREQYCTRKLKEQLSIEDLQFDRLTPAGVEMGFRLRAASLRPSPNSGEEAWFILCISASIYAELQTNSTTKVEPEEDDDFPISVKRLRRSRPMDELLRYAKSTHPPTRTYALQVIAISLGRHPFEEAILQETTDLLTSIISSDDSAMIPWAILAVAILAAHDDRSTRLSSWWPKIWKLIARHVTAASTCEIACQALSIILETELVGYFDVVDDIHNMLEFTDINGPALCGGAAIRLWKVFLGLKRREDLSTDTNMSGTVMRWLYRCWKPSKIEDRTHLAQIAHHVSISEHLDLACRCMGLSPSQTDPSAWRRLGRLSQTSYVATRNAELVGFLFQVDKKASTENHPRLQLVANSDQNQQDHSSQQILFHALIEFLEQECSLFCNLMSTGSSTNSTGINVEVICIIVQLLIFGYGSLASTHQHLPRHENVVRLLDQLQENLKNLMLNHEKRRDFTNAFCDTIGPVIGHLDDIVPEKSGLACGIVATAQGLNQSFWEAALEELSTIDVDRDELDVMDIDMDFDSQATQKRGTEQSSIAIHSEIEATSNMDAFRACVAAKLCYASTFKGLRIEARPSSRACSSVLVEYLTSLQRQQFVLCWKVLQELLASNVTLSEDDADTLLQYVQQVVIQPYDLEKSEVATGICIDSLASLAHMWTTAQENDIAATGAELYVWFMKKVLGEGTPSSHVSSYAADLLQQVIKFSPDYAKGLSLASARTTLLQVLRDGNLLVKHHIGTNIAKIFGLFVLKEHANILEDIIDSLPSDPSWIEGIALRLNILGNLAAVWPTLLRRCTYAIFETAGHVPHSVAFARRCVVYVSNKLDLSGSRVLFRLFAPQLIYTWLETQALGLVPYKIFSYESLKELLQDIQDEVVGQVMMRGKAEESIQLATDLSLPFEKLLAMSFGKVATYCIARDIAVSPSDDSQAPQAEARLRKVVGRELYASLVNKHFPEIIAFFFLTTDYEEQIQKAFQKHEMYANANARYQEIVALGSSEKVLPPNQQPSFKSKYLLAEIDHLCSRTRFDFEAIWTPALYVHVFRKIINCTHPALGSLHTCSILRKIRILLCVAGQIALEGYPLKMSLHALRPFLTDAQCADDVVGLMQYLMTHGATELRETPSFLIGHAVTTLISMKHFLSSSQDSTTQESHFRATISRAQAYHAWLVSYLEAYESPRLSSQAAIDFQVIARAAGSLRSSGSARKGSPESDLLMAFLDDQMSGRNLLPRSSRDYLLSFLSTSFEVPSNFRDDILGDDSKAVQYAPVIWDTCRSASAGAKYLTWSGRVLGRSYASQALIDKAMIHETNLDMVHTDSSGSGVLSNSRLRLLTLLSSLLARDGREEVGLAENALGYIVTQSHSTVYAPECEKALEPKIYSAMLCLQYDMPMRLVSARASTKRPQMNEIAPPTKDENAISWIRNLGEALSHSVTDDPLLTALSGVLSKVDGLAQEAFPYILHLVLLRQSGSQEVAKSKMSYLFRHLFEISEINEGNRPIVRIFLNAMMYLRTQPLPHETVKTDRIHWLDVDFRQAAVTASRCAMYKSALMFIEIEESEKGKTEAASRRKSSRRQEHTESGDDLLLTIYQHVDEQDAFYGVNQPSSLSSMMSQLEYEHAGFKGLSFRGAFYDCQIRQTKVATAVDTDGMVQALNNVDLNGLSQPLVSRLAGSGPRSIDAALSTARKLERWDVSPPSPYSSSACTVYEFYRRISNATDASHITAALDSGFEDTLRRLLTDKASTSSLRANLSSLATLTEAEEVFSSQKSDQIEEVLARFQARDRSLEFRSYDHIKDILSCRETSFSCISKHPRLQGFLKIPLRDARLMECRNLLSSSAVSRTHGALQNSLSTATYLDHLVEPCKLAGIDVAVASRFESAHVLWNQGEMAASVRLLQDLSNGLSKNVLGPQAIPVGKPGLLAKLGHHTAEARLEKPEAIIQGILRQAVKELHSLTTGDEAGEVFHEFASFCDQQLQNADSLADFRRLKKLREHKEAEVRDLDRMIKSAGSQTKEKETIKSHRSKAQQWFELDDKEYRRLESSRLTLVNYSIENYLLCLKASDRYDNDALRFSAMWLENNENHSANEAVARHVSQVPSRKFAALINQWTSRLIDVASPFQSLLFAAIQRICIDHPYHGLYQIFAVSKTKGGKDETAIARHAAANKIVEKLKTNAYAQAHWLAVHNTSVTFVRFASDATKDPSIKPGSKVALRKSQTGQRVEQDVLKIKIPPPTMTVEIRADCDYSSVPTIARFQPEYTVAGGLSMPKIVTALGTDGKKYKQLFKGGHDDLRQDAIMEQVFEAVSSLLKTQRATRQRDLKIRTYKVLPLTANAGVIEFVQSTTPLHEYLLPAHERHYPRDLKRNTARKYMQDAQSSSAETRIKIFRKVCEQYHPVLRYFFFERFDSPDDWFEKRLAYTRSTAAISILGYILGLGDRHGHNILLDEKTGEVVHIDLGIAFEQGRVLPIPEVVPFRLTRDIVDGMGITGTEGVFRRCCEFTLEALRNESYSIMSILDVLRYDPLYSWTLSPLRLKKMQDGQTEDPALPAGSGGGGGKKEEEAGEAERALLVVAKKLSRTLSVQATVNELIQQATDERNLAVLFCGWAAYA